MSEEILYAGSGTRTGLTRILKLGKCQTVIISRCFLLLANKTTSTRDSDRSVVFESPKFVGQLAYYSRLAFMMTSTCIRAETVGLVLGLDRIQRLGARSLTSKLLDANHDLPNQARLIMQASRAELQKVFSYKSTTFKDGSSCKTLAVLNMLFGL